MITTARTDEPRSATTRRWLMLATPPLVAAVVIWHPRDPARAMELVDRTGLWIGIHVALLAVLPLLAATVWWLVAPLRGTAASVARAALAPALVLYAAFDALVGLGTGVLVRHAADLPAAQQAAAASLVEEWWAVPFPINVISGLAQLAWVVALGGTAVAHARAGARRPVQVALFAATALFPLLHVQPFGALSMVALLAAVVLLRPPAPTVTAASPAPVA